MSDFVIIRDGDFSSVPSRPGVYAWFYPLFVYENDSLMTFYNRVKHALKFRATRQSEIKVFFDSEEEQKFYHYFKNERSFSYSEFLFSESMSDPSDLHCEQWDNLRDKPNEWLEFKKQLLAASIYLKPLYIGKAMNLSQRINQHLNYVQHTNNFGNRFEKHMRELKGLIGHNNQQMYGLEGSIFVRDLHLSFVPFNDQFDDQFNQLYEKIIQHLVQPNFSER